MAKVKIRGVIRRMIPEYAIYEAEIEMDEEELEYKEDFLDQYFNDELRYDYDALAKLEFKKASEDPQRYYKYYFSGYSDLEWQCTDYEIVEESE